MKPKHRWVKFTIAIVVVMFSLQLASCGYLLYPERRGQTHGRIDPAVAVLDGLGLLLYVVPGLIAFAVDFTTGTIYLPGGKKKASTNPSAADEMLVIHVNPEELSKEKLEEIISNQTGNPISLDQKDMQVFELDMTENIDMELLKLASAHSEIISKVHGQ
jgi:hypothetical protein